MSKIKWVVGMDCALRNTGVSIFNNLGEKVECFNIKTKKGQTDHDSIDCIVEEFFDRCGKYLDKPEGQSVTRIYFELVFFGKVGKATARAEAIGVLKWNLRQDGHQLFGVEPKALNSFLANRLNFKYPKGSKQIKEATMQMLHRHCGFYTRDDNMADAYVAGLYGCAHTFEKQRLSPTALSRMI
jgi:hypothetical protein